MFNKNQNKKTYKKPRGETSTEQSQGKTKIGKYQRMTEGERLIDWESWLLEEKQMADWNWL